MSTIVLPRDSGVRKGIIHGHQILKRVFWYKDSGGQSLQLHCTVPIFAQLIGALKI